MSESRLPDLDGCSRRRSHRPQENACGGAQRRGASDDDRREEGFPRHPPSGFGAGGQDPKKGFFLGPRRRKKKMDIFSFDGGGWVVAGAKNSFPDGVLIRGSGLV